MQHAGKPFQVLTGAASASQANKSWGASPPVPELQTRHGSDLQA